MQLDGYSDLTLLAEGGMAKVFKGRQLSLNRTVAIKVLSAECQWDKVAKQLFDQESLVVAQLHHPNIVHVIDRGLTEKGRPYFVMEYIQGSDLLHYVRDNEIKLNGKIGLVMQVCKAMSYAHKNGVIHRDIKPGNILVDKEGYVHILDFGIAWLAASGRPENIVGTPDYMSPEQFNHPESVTHSSDIYSLGVVMYELFTGRLPAPYFDHLLSSMSMLPPRLAELINDCLQTSIASRPANADEVRLCLLQLLQGAHIDERQKDEAGVSVGKNLDKFALLDVIRQDRYGAVYLFEDKRNHEPFVVKKRIKSEAGLEQAKLLVNLKHDNLIRILGTSRSQNAFIVVMEYLTGGSLQERLSRPYELAKFKSLAITICDAMAFAHKHHVIHGNLRPSNILFDGSNRIKITDFGFDAHYAITTFQRDWYCCPEVLDDKEFRDIYSAGAIFFHMLTGEHVLYEHGRIQPGSAFSDLNDELRHLLRNMMEPGASKRFKSFTQVAAAVRKIKTGKPKFRRYGIGKRSRFGLWRLLLTVLLLGLLGVVGYILMQPDGFEILKKMLLPIWQSNV